MKVVSCFTGIGTLDLALRQCGVEVTTQVEIDPASRRVARKHFPEVEQVEDIRDYVPLGKIDILIGGFPCMGVSSAGLRNGMAHPQTNLWRMFARIIRICDPSLVLIENPSSLLHRGRGFNQVMKDLRHAGYYAQWECVPASAVGAPHRRDRIWIAAFPRPDRMADPDFNAWSMLRFPDEVSNPWSSLPGCTLGVESSPSVRTRLRQLGLAAVPQAAIEAWRILSRGYRAQVPRTKRRAGLWAAAVDPMYFEPVHQIQRKTPMIPTPIAADSRASGRAGRAAGSNPGVTLTDWVRFHVQAPYVNPEFVEWLLGLPPGWSAVDEEK